MKSEILKQQLMDQVLRFATGRIERARAAQVDAFIQQFYANVPVGDIAQEPPEDLFCAALSLWQFAGKRQPGKPKLRVFNPRQDEHGWRSPHTIVEIVNDDMPFLVDSVTAELGRLGLDVHLVVHPIMRVTRDAAGQMTELGQESAPAESIMQIRITQIAQAAKLEQVAQRLEAVLGDVRNAVADWKEMRARLAESIAEIEKKKLPVTEDERAEVSRFLKWIEDDHFTFLGYREYTVGGKGDETAYGIVEQKSLGVLRDFHVRIFGGMRNTEAMPSQVRSYLRQPKLLFVTKANTRSTVHRDVPMDVFGVKIFDKKGEVVGERLFAGLFTAVAYNRSPREIPLLQRKVETVLNQAGFAPNSHDGKALAHILETYPRDELFQATEAEILETALGILHLQERQRIALFLRRDPFERFVTCLIFLPKDAMSTQIRLRMQEVVCEAFKGTLSAYYVHLGDGALARIQLIVATHPGAVPEVALKELEAKLAEVARSWADRLRDALVDAKGEALGMDLLRRYRDAFPAGYDDHFNAHSAVHDIDRVEEAKTRPTPAINLYRPIEAASNELRLKLYQAKDKIALSTVLPSLENFGLKVISEIPFEITPEGDDRAVWIHDFTMVTADGADVDVPQIRDKFHDAYARIWAGEAEDDGFNRLVITAGIGWRNIALLRAYCKYLRQAAIAFSQAYMEQTLNANAVITRDLVHLFYVLFDPGFANGSTGANREKEVQAVQERILKGLDAVVNLDEDRILRRFLNAVQCTLRTNYFQRDGNGNDKDYISFKLDSHKIEELPLPRPLVEVFVYSPRAEAIHLRGGKVARGGIRWSDRREDFRTEVLGLMKAQMTKNAVIVPVGSKGGFVVKRPPQSTDRETVMAEVVHCYKTLMRGLLDITDNAAGGKVKPPKDVVRRDGDDPYLVVAADKGTATFSDIANGVSRDYGFWLDDAFASGGSAGYDHKKMGITARGAWECVKRHFREIGKDIQASDFTCVGVGDMSGDVFGNGMLLSPHTRLVAAFNHMHIFLDPDPDPKASHAERVRLFNLPRSAWSDYDAKLISKGGGIYERKLKSIPVSPEMRAVLGFDKEQATPSELIKAILKAEIDLLFFGGIGTYVRATHETNAEVGDRANDSLRITGAEIRAKVVGEGANLGVTQRGRVEAALAGIRLNTDALDNSAGVDTSDHEVNIKILLNEAVTAGDLTMKQRDKLLAEMTDDVAELVLRDNYLQSQALSVAEAQGYTLIDQQNRFMRALERAGQLDRAIEFLPDDETVRLRLSQRVGMTRPESAVLLAYAKNSIYDELLPSDLPDDAQLEEDLISYFPPALQKTYVEQIRKHRLRREIIATVVTNSLINRMGATFVHIMKERTGQPSWAIARAYAITRGAFRLRELWLGIQALDNKAPAKIQTEMLIEINRLAEQATQWFLRNGKQPLDIAANVAAASPSLAALESALPGIVAAEDARLIGERLKHLVAQGVPEALAQRVAQMPALTASLDIVRIAGELKMKVEDVGRTYFAVGEAFHLDWLRSGARTLIGDSHWDRLAVFAIIEDLYGHQRDLTTAILSAPGGAPAAQAASAGADAIAAWRATRGAALTRADALFADLIQVGKLDLAMLAVANRTLRSLIG